VAIVGLFVCVFVRFKHSIASNAGPITHFLKHRRKVASADYCRDQRTRKPDNPKFTIASSPRQLIIVHAPLGEGGGALKLLFCPRKVGSVCLGKDIRELVDTQVNIEIIIIIKLSR